MSTIGEPHGPYEVFRHPDYPNVEVWIVGDPADPSNPVTKIQLRGATREQLPFVLNALRELAPGIEPDIIP